MDRRALLAATGALATATIAGCLGDSELFIGTGDDDLPNPGVLPAAEPDVTDEFLAELAAGNAAFSSDLYRYLVTGREDNLFFSPHSISTALAMTYAGAAGHTADEMESTLHYTLADEVHEAFAALSHELATREATEDEVDAFVLRVANALWGREGYGFSEAYLDTLQEYYGAGLIEADFTGDPSGERQRINEWVADATEGKIEEVLPENAIGSNTVFVITNAIYFLASWLSEFDPGDTSDEAFTAMDGSTSDVQMMHQHLETPYASVGQVDVLELPYVGGDVSMVLMLPASGRFEEFEAQLTGEAILGMFHELERAEGFLALPQFEIESTVSLSAVLTDLGMPSAFESADFSNMVENGGGIWIDEIYHDAVVTVDEQGTEAAAATAVVGVDSVPPSWGELRFDRPFVFCIRDRPTDTILFLGRVADAAQE